MASENQSAGTQNIIPLYLKPIDPVGSSMHWTFCCLLYVFNIIIIFIIYFLCDRRTSCLSTGVLILFTGRSYCLLVFLAS